MKTRVGLAVLLCAVSVVALSSCTADKAMTVDSLLADLFASSEEGAISAAIASLIEADPEPLEVAEALRSGPATYPEQEPGWQVHEFACQDGKSRYFHVFIPDSYDPTVPHALLISLHGSVMQAGYTIEQFLFRRQMWESVAQRDGFIILMPHGDHDAPWWSEASRQNTHDMLRWIKQACNIDDNRVFLAGFSDGAAGTYWMAFHDPTAWAGFLPIYGAVSSPEQGPYQCYPSNLNQRMILASNGTGESYVRQAATLIAQLQSQGVSLFWTLHPTEHNLVQAMVYERERASDFMAIAVRDPSRPVIAWKTAHVETGRCDWIEITQVREDEAPARVQDLNLTWESEAVQFGVGIEYRGEAEGFVVSGIEPGTIARELGIQNGDRMVRIDDMSVRTQMEVSAAMETKAMGDPIEVEIVRGDEHLVLQGVLPEYPPVYRRDLPTAAVHAQANGNTVRVETQNVDRFRILVSDKMFDLSQPLTIVCNGAPVFSGEIKPNLEFMLHQWDVDRDRSTVYITAIEIEVPAPGDSG